MRVDRLTLAQALIQTESLVSIGRLNHLITANTLMTLAARQDPELQKIIDAAALVVPESWGIYWAARRQGIALDEFVPGIDFMSALCRQAAKTGRSIFLLGSGPGVSDIAAERLEAAYPGLRIAGTQHGYFSNADTNRIVARIRASKPSYLFVGLSMPAQEKWIARHLEALNVPIVMGVGGSFDVISGRLKRAPAVMRRLGLEWMYRFSQEPWRWRRMLQLPLFMGLVLRDRLRR